MLSLSFPLPMMWSNLPLARLCNCSVIGASGSRAVLGSVTDWFCTLGATIAVVDGPEVSPAELAGRLETRTAPMVTWGGDAEPPVGAPYSSTLQVVDFACSWRDSRINP